MFLIYFKGEVIPPPYVRNNIDKVKNNSIKYIKIDFMCKCICGIKD